MDETAALVAIHTLRIQPAYQQAERLRRKARGGATELANGKEDTEEYAAVKLLVNTWETIAAILESVESRDRIYEILPICYMHNALKDAVVIISLKHANLKGPEQFDVPNNGYGAKFTKLSNDYKSWLLEKHKTTQYISGACGGMQAFFG